LPELLKYPDACVFVCEGEKDADRVASLDHCATTVASSKWTDDCVGPLAGRDVLILEDNDKAGRKKALEAAQALHGTAKTIRIVRLPNLPEKGDVSDWFDADARNAEKFVDACFDAPLWEPKADKSHEKTEAREGEAEPQGSRAKTDNAALIKTSAQFIAGFVPPNYVIVGLLQRRFLYSCTGATGAGKTAIMLRLAASTAIGLAFAGRQTKKCRVLYAAAENPDDVRMRWIALAQNMGFDPSEISVFFTEGRFTLSKAAAKLREEAMRLGGEFGLVIIDTGPAFFEGDDENSRAQMGAHARLMRTLIAVIPGGPCVVVNCHPVKNAENDNLLPAGGGTFLNEVDGNLTVARDESVSELHWQGKFRGPEFAPMNFLLKTVTHQDLVDNDRRLIPTIICEALTEQAREEFAAAARKDEDEVLRLIDNDPGASLSKLAHSMGWKLYSGEPNKMRAMRCVSALKRAKLIKETRVGKRHLTPEGKKSLEGEKA
jgi:5S rRNA maturation endonuclease (ribonuclease M5)